MQGDIFRIYQKHLALRSKTEKLKIAVLDFFKQRKLIVQYNDICQKIYNSKSAKKIENYYLLKSLEISWFWTKNLKEKYYHLYCQTVLLKIIYKFIFMTIRLKFGNFIQILWILNSNKYILVRLDKGFCIIRKLQYMHYNLVSMVLLALPISIDTKQVTQQ